MVEEQHQEQHTPARPPTPVPKAAFPTPPPFYQHFTKTNIDRLRQLRKDAGVSVSRDNAIDEQLDFRDIIDIASLPEELRYLVPPQPPENGQSKIFGQETALDVVDPTLEKAEVEQLYPDDPSVRLNPQPHLIALARSTLTTFLSMSGTLAQNAELVHDKEQDLRTIVFNMHDLINQYRPHQARETLIMEMETRLNQMQNEISAIDAQRKKVAKLLQELQQSGRVQTDQDGGNKDITVVQNAPDAKRKARQRAAWAALEAALG